VPSGQYTVAMDWLEREWVRDGAAVSGHEVKSTLMMGEEEGPDRAAGLSVARVDEVNGATGGVVWWGAPLRLGVFCLSLVVGENIR